MDDLNDIEKVVRSVCGFATTPSEQALLEVEEVASQLERRGFTLQTKRLCCSDVNAVLETDRRLKGSFILSVGRQDLDEARSLLDDFCSAPTLNFNIELADEASCNRAVDLWQAVAERAPEKTFNFTYTVNNAASSPFYPSATYQEDGFAIGLQPTNLSVGCRSVDEWLDRVEEVWREVDSLFRDRPSYLGIDTSIAPLLDGPGSLVSFLKRLGFEFDRAATTDLFLRITRRLKAGPVRTVGLCGLMLPCLEDFELADEYEEGNFSVERCLFLSLHSGLGLDSYPVAADESPERIGEVLSLMRGLSIKHRKPLSARFISDGRAKVGERTDFGSPYLRDVVVRPL